MDAKFWLDVVQWIVTLGVMIFVWIDRGRSDNRRLIQKLGERQELQEQRLTRAEEGLRHTPTHDDFAKLQAEVSGVQSTLNRVTSTLDRIHDYLMNSKA
ncbi:DUF2730 family protein [Marinobacterium rhizophilum]|uniref:DUF2730 family protein n=1 Tax=Marinobacterium rhizophilum TaxID=420402 RepID=A0ABY5HNY0_9GAMM|nr:DUF2730 family protein [Marinobacterium rhizophilum]UTW12947.1 DUF2730 family protein [Marinobacterium rhizophilum]